MWAAGDQPRVGLVQGKLPTLCTIALAQSMQVSNILFCQYFRLLDPIAFLLSFSVEPL